MPSLVKYLTYATSFIILFGTSLFLNIPSPPKDGSGPSFWASEVVMQGDAFILLLCPHPDSAHSALSTCQLTAPW